MIDSGKGGRVVERYLRSMTPDLDITYASDAAHMPYGNRSTAEILELIDALIAPYAGTYDILVPACNTMSVAMLSAGRVTPRVVDIIMPTVRAMSKQHHRKIGVISTLYTHRSRIYERSLRAMSCGSESLARLVEEDRVEEIDEELERMLRPMLARGIRKIVLGCTHYELIDHRIRALHPHLELLYPGKYQAEAVLRRLTNPARYGIVPLEK